MHNETETNEPLYVTLHVAVKDLEEGVAVFNAVAAAVYEKLGDNEASLYVVNEDNEAVY